MQLKGIPANTDGRNCCCTQHSVILQDSFLQVCRLKALRDFCKGVSVHVGIAHHYEPAVVQHMLLTRAKRKFPLGHISCIPFSKWKIV